MLLTQSLYLKKVHHCSNHKMYSRRKNINKSIHQEALCAPNSKATKKRPRPRTRRKKKGRSLPNWTKRRTLSNQKIRLRTKMKRILFLHLRTLSKSMFVVYVKKIRIISNVLAANKCKRKTLIELLVRWEYSNIIISNWSWMLSSF